MSLSRVESRNRELHNKGKRKRKRRIALLINFSLLLCIVAVVVYIYQGEIIKDAVQSVAANFQKSQQQQAGSLLDSALDEKPNVEEASGDIVEDTTNEQIPAEAEELPNATEQSTEQEQIAAENEAVPLDVQVQLAFVGDILLGEYINGFLEQQGYNYPFEKALFHLSSADITAGNLEMPITTVDQPQNKTYVFRGKPEALSGLVYSGIDVVSLANNHTLDHGVDGLLETKKNLDEYGVISVGAGNNAEEAYAPYIKEVNGIKIAYVGTSRVVPEVSWKATKYQAGVAESYEPSQTLASIEKLEEEADITVVLVHWGEEREHSPNTVQKDLAKKYIDAGADIVIGSHPHVLQGFEQYNGKWIAYSLGNFVFSAHPRERQAETGVLTATCTDKADCSLQFSPMKIVNAQPTPLEGEAAQSVLEFLQEISIGEVRIDEMGLISSE